MRDLLDGLGPLSFPTVDGGDSSIDGIGATDKLYMTLSGGLSLLQEGEGMGWEGRGSGEGAREREEGDG